jgi:hypothetical protein
MPNMLTKSFLVTVCIALLTRIVSGQTVPPPTETVILTSAPPYTVTGELYILKADTNAVALHDPVLVVEGFDIDNSMNWPELYDLLNQENLVNDIQAYGRDLVVLNFTDSTVDIFANAALNEAAINYINDHRANPNDKFVVVGASLGGLTARKALVDMPNPDVDTWISFDAPHHGANIPLGLQEYVEFFAQYDTSANNLLVSLDSPAARQLLVVHHSNSDGLAGGSIPERGDFQSAMDAMGYPTNCKSIAICNGSGFGEPYPFSPADHIIHWTGTTVASGLNVNITSDIYALPQTQSTVFYAILRILGFITYDSATVNAYHPLSFDNAPGGGRGTFLQLYTNIPPDQISGDDYCNQTNHCFVPTVSALGIPIENLESNLAANASLTALSPFDEIHYADHNEPHVEINAHNKRWIMRALLEGIDTDGDGLDDYEEYLIGTAYDSAESTLITALDIASQPTNATVGISWNCFPNTRYDVWFTDDLNNPWQVLETIPPSTNPVILREYATDPETSAGFFRVVASPIDPVTD